MRRLLPALLLAFWCGCAPQSLRLQEMTVVPDVPGFSAQQRSDDCGAVALASLLAHAGYEVKPATVDRSIYDPVLGGSLLPEMENFAAGLGAAPRTGRGDTGFLRARIAAERPVLVPIDLGWSVWRRPHYVVVFGFGPDGFLLHRRAAETVVMAAEEFDRRWAKTGRLYLYLEENR